MQTSQNNIPLYLLRIFYVPGTATESTKDFDEQQRENLLQQNSTFCVSPEFTHFQLEGRIRTRD